MLSKCCKAPVWVTVNGMFCRKCNKKCEMYTMRDIEQLNSDAAREKQRKEIEDGGRDTRARTEEWLAENPTALSVFEKYAMEQAARGKKLGMQALIERVRWDFSISTSGSEFKINNSFAPYIARKLIERHPELEEYLELRKVKW